MYAKNREAPFEQAIIRDPLTIAASATVAEAIAMMSIGSQTCNLLCDIDSETNLQLADAQNNCILVTEGKKLIGILTERDLVKLCGQNANHDYSSPDLAQNLIETAIAEVMVYPVHALLDWEFTDILVPISRFHRYNIRHLPLVNDCGEVVGLLTHESLRQLLRPIDSQGNLLKTLQPNEIYKLVSILETKMSRLKSDRKRTEIALSKSEQRLKSSESLLSAMFEQSPVGMAITDINGRFIRTNPCYQEMVGYSESELELMRFTDNTITEDLEENLKLRELILSDESESYQMEKRLVHRDGKIIWVRTTSSKILDDINKSPLFVGVIEDITDRKQAEIERQDATDALYQLNQQLESRVEQRTQELQLTNQQLSAVNDELARATRLKDEFLANMSHELRTPLNAVLGMSEGLMTGVFGDLNERQMRSLSLIETSGRHLLELINDILDVAKIGAGKLELDITPVAIEYLCKSSLNFVKQIANQKNIQLKLSISPSIKMVAVDERRIRQSLINLLSNAVKFTPKGGKVCLEAKIQKIESTELTIKSAYELIFSITDTGIGISPEDIRNLFQAFVQIDSSLNRQYAGTGLGLTLVKQITELHGGYVNVSSQVGEGSCFSIFLPYIESIKLGKSEQAPQSSVESHDRTGDLENDFLAVNPLILLVEDNPINIETFSNYLTSRGYRLIFASDGQEAINIAIAQKPDLILMDIQMPVLDGISAIAKIRETPDININSIPIVALTALAMIGDRERCLEIGANEYLTKPVKLSHLTAIIQKHLQKK